MTEEETDEECLASNYRLHQNNIVKEVVPPVVYNGCCKLSMRNFFKDFERFFAYKYIGNDRDRCRILSNYLDGEALEVFKVLGGNFSKYLEVKEGLLTWYDSQRIVRRYREKWEFYDAKMKVGESLTLYCMRMKVLAGLAFPQNPVKAFKKLKSQLFATLPEWFISCMEERMDLKEYMCLGLLSWTDIIDIAVREDKKLLKAHTIGKNTYFSKEEKSEILSQCGNLTSSNGNVPSQLVCGTRHTFH